MKDWVSKEMVEKAMQVNLLSYAQSLGMNFMQQGDNWYLKDNKGVHSLNISASKNRYYRFSTGRGGNVIQFAQEMNGWNFQDAVRALCGEDIQKNHYNTVPQNSTEAHTPPVKEKMVLPPAHTDSRRVFAYLAKTRGIDTEIISELMKEHKIYENDKHSCVFVGYDEKGEPGYASMRSTYTQGTAFKGEVRGSSKEVPFTMKGSSDSVFVFEAPIDCMSHASIVKFAGGDWHADWRISLGGFADLGLEQFLKQHPEIKNIHFCTDNDAQGIAVLENSYNQDGSLKKAGYIKKYTDKGYNVFRDEPKNKDFNEDLQELRDMQQNIDEVEVVEEAMELG